LVPNTAIRRDTGPEFAFGEVANGYGWLFPKGDHVNVGLYTRADDPSLSKERLRDYARARLGTDRVEHITGFPLGFGGSRKWPVQDRVVLVGDAAGYAEPLLGEGIHNAVKSGLLAAQALILADAAGESFGRNYRRLARVIEADLRRCGDMAGLFYGHLDTLGPALLGFAPGKAALLRGFAAGKTMREITNTALLAPLWRAAKPAVLTTA
jgi:flavin-dependent dehydrogenase